MNKLKSILHKLLNGRPMSYKRTAYNDRKKPIHVYYDEMDRWWLSTNRWGINRIPFNKAWER